MRFDIINERKKALGLTNSDIAEMTGLTLSTLDKITSGANQNPRLDTLQKIAEAIGCSLDDFSNKKRLSAEATNIAIDYDNLDKPGKRTVRVVLESEKQRMQETATRFINVPTISLSERQIEKIVKTFELRSAAGLPIFGDDERYENIGYPAEIVPDGTDFAVRISGHSMEDTIQDGETVFVHECSEVNNNDIVIAWIDAEGLVCKRAEIKGDRLIRLTSDNREFPGFEGAVLNNVRIYGRVIGHTNIYSLR